MEKKILIIIIFAIVIISSLIFFYFLSGSTSNDEIDDISTFDITDNMDKLLGTWNDVFYITDDDSTGTWVFYSNSSIKLEVSGYTYDKEYQTEIDWYSYKLENNQICVKFDSQNNYICYDYFFGKSYNHLTLTTEENITERSIIYLNK
jgi:hypothetical protein